MNDCKKIYDLGFNLLPLGADKKPECCWKQYQTERVDPDVFATWRERQAFFLITGATPWKESPGLVAIDCDDQEALDCWLSNAPDTPLKTKTSRGYHLFYKHPGYRVRNRVGQWSDGREYKIDIRGDGG